MDQDYGDIVRMSAAMDPLRVFEGVPQVSENIFMWLLLPELETCRSVCSEWKLFLDGLISRKKSVLEKRYVRHCWFHKELRRIELTGMWYENEKCTLFFITL